MTDSIAWILENMSLATLLLALFLGAIGAKRKKNAQASGWEPTVFWLMFLFVGIAGLYSGILHLAWPAKAAATIGWAVSPFQWEVGVADLTIGVLGCMGAFASRPFRWAVVVALSLFYWGDAIGHVRQMELTGDMAPGNAGSWFWVDVIGPVALLIAHGLNRSGRNA